MPSKILPLTYSLPLLLFICLPIFLMGLHRSSVHAQGGQTYYVAPDGNDANPGTLELPFESIQHSVDLALPGDTIYVREGIYHEAVRVDVSGALGNPIRILAFPEEQPVIDGEYTLPGGTPATPSIINNPPIPPEEFVWGPLVRIRGSYIEFRGFDVIRSRGRGIGVNGVPGAYNTDIVVSDCLINGARNAGIHNVYTQNVLYERCEVTDAGNYAPYSRSPYVLNWPVIVNSVSSINVTVRESRIYRSWGEGIGAGRDSQQITFEDNLIYDNMAMQLYVHRSQQVTIRRNFIYHSNDPQYRRGSNPSQCIVVNNETNFTSSINTDQILIQNNVIVGCLRLIALWGSGSQVPISNVTVEHNALVNAVGNNGPEDAYAIEVASANPVNVLFQKNVIYQQGFQVATVVDDPEVQFVDNAWTRQPPTEASGPGDWVGDPLLNDPNLPLVAGEMFVEAYQPSGASPLPALGIGPTAYIAFPEVTGCLGWPTGGCPPDAPVLLAPNNVPVGGTPTFTWQPVDGATEYNLVIYDVDNELMQLIENISASTICTELQCSYQPQNTILLPGNFKWLLSAASEDGQSTWAGSN